MNLTLSSLLFVFKLSADTISVLSSFVKWLSLLIILELALNDYLTEFFIFFVILCFLFTTSILLLLTSQHISNSF